MRWPDDSGVTLSALPIFQPAQRVWLKQNVYAALRTDRACLRFVVRVFIAIPSMVCAGSSCSSAVYAAPAMARRGEFRYPVAFGDKADVVVKGRYFRFCIKRTCCLLLRMRLLEVRRTSCGRHADVMSP